MSLLSSLAFVLFPLVKPRDDPAKRMLERLIRLESEQIRLNAEIGVLGVYIHQLERRLANLDMPLVVNDPNQQARNSDADAQWLQAQRLSAGPIHPSESALRQYQNACTCVPGRYDALVNFQNRQEQAR